MALGLQGYIGKGSKIERIHMYESELESLFN